MRTVLTAGLRAGRMPEYLGRKIKAYDACEEEWLYGCSEGSGTDTC